MDIAVLRDFEQHFERIHLSGGETLMRQGDRGDCVFVLMSGRLRVYVEHADGTEASVGEIARGEVVGEMSILTDAPRSATVRAIRDSELARFTREILVELLERHPHAVLQITRQIVTRLQRSIGAPSPGNKVATLTVIPAGKDAPVSLFAHRLAEALGRHGSTLHLSSRDVDEHLGEGAAQTPQHGPGSNRILAWLNEQESKHDYVIYEADPHRSNWGRRCLRQADRVLAVGRASAGPALGDIEQEVLRHGGVERFARHDLVLLYEDGQQPSGTREWLSLRRVDRHHHLRLFSDADFKRLVRYITGRSMGIVLGGGGARGLSHVGALRAIEESGIPVDAIGGTSMGAIIAAMRAMGLDHAHTYAACKKYFVEGGSLLDFTLPLVSITSGARITRRLASFFGDARIEDLLISYFCVSSNLTRAEMVVHRDGTVWKQVRASISLPGILPPVFQDGDLLVDGGVTNNLPVDVMRTFCQGGCVIALDVSPKVDLTHKHAFPEEISGWRVLGRRINPFARTMDVPPLAGILMRTTLLGSASKQNLMALQADLVIRPPLEQFGLLEFKSFDRIVEIGYKHALEQLEAWSASRRDPEAPADA